MHKGLLAALLMTVLALAGCSGGGDKDADFEDVACPDGTVVTSEQIEAVPEHHDEGFDPATLCPVPPQVVLTGLPASVQVYGKAPFSWSVDPGSVTHGHSMITEIRFSTAHVADADASTTTYPKQVLKKEHQDLPVTFKGNMTFSTPGKVYVRAYAAVQGEGYDRRDVWGPEVVLDVLNVTPTGTVVPITHTAGAIAGSLEGPEGQLALGDAVSFQNDDLLEHTLSLVAAPPGAAACVLAAAMQAASSDTCVLTVPGSYEFETDDAQPKTVSVSVAMPA